MQGGPYRHAVFPISWSHPHWQILSDQEHPAHSYPNRKQPHVPLHLNSETDKPDHNSIQEAALLLFLPKVGRTQKSLIHSSENNRDRNDAGKYIPNDSHSGDDFLQGLLIFSSHNA